MKLLKLLPVKSKKQIAGEYQVSARTFRRWLQIEKLQLPSRYLTPKDQEKVYKRFGEPPEVQED